MSEPVVVSGDAVDWEGWGEHAADRGDVTWRTLIDARRTASEGLSLGVGRLRPGEALFEHRHTQAEVYLVLAGVVTVSIAGVERELAEGDSAFVPGGVTHGVRNAGAAEARFAFVFATDSAADVDYTFAA